MTQHTVTGSGTGTAAVAWFGRVRPADVAVSLRRQVDACRRALLVADEGICANAATLAASPNRLPSGTTRIPSNWDCSAELSDSHRRTTRMPYQLGQSGGRRFGQPAKVA